MTIENGSLKYYKGLDGVRGIAALMIMFYHFMPGGNNAGSFLYFLKRISVIGQSGVTLFFVLSGFLITRILLNSKSNAGYFKSFYIKRALRIFPLYYLFLIICFFIIPAINHQPFPPFNLSWYYYFYLQNIPMTFNIKIADLPHLWSLAVEEHFYLIWPFLVFYLSPRALLKVISGIVFFSLICKICLINMGYGTYYFTLTTFDCLAVGAFLALFENHAWVNKKNMFKIGLITCVPLLISFWFVSGTSNDYVQYFKTLIVSIVSFALIGYVIKSDSRKNIFNLTFLRYTGKISYGLYIFHPVCYAFIYQYWHTGIFLADLFISFSVAYAIATLSFYLFELRFLAMKDKLRLKPELAKV